MSQYQVSRLAVTDAANVSLSETVALITSGIVTKTTSDTLSVSATEGRSLYVTLDVTDTVSVSVSDASVLVTPTQSLAPTDTLSISVDEDAVRGIFTGVIDFPTYDDVLVSVADTALVDPNVLQTVRPMRIRIIPRIARIRIVAL